MKTNPRFGPQKSWGKKAGKTFGKRIPFANRRNLRTQMPQEMANAAKWVKIIAILIKAGKAGGYGKKINLNADKDWMHPKVRPLIEKMVARRLLSGFSVPEERLRALSEEMNHTEIVREIALAERVSAENAKKRAIAIFTEIVGPRDAEIRKILHGIEGLNLPQNERVIARDAIATISNGIVNYAQLILGGLKKPQ